MMSPIDSAALALHVETSDGVWPVITVDGRPLHSRRNPLDEAERWAAQFLMETQPKEQDTVVLFGSGWGWHAMALRARWEGDLYVHEPIEALRPGLSPGPSRPWEPGELPWFPFDSVSDEYRFAYSLRKDVTVHLSAPPVYKRLFAERWESFRQLIASLVRETSLYHLTAKERGVEWAEHSFANAPDFLPAYGVAELDDIATGLPVFVVAAGPSLDRNVALLAEARQRGIVIAVNHALKALHRAGIEPHLVVALEGRNVMGHFDVPPSYFSRQILATAAHPDLFTLPFATRWLAHILEDPVAHRMLSALGDRGLVGAGGSVATMSFGLASRMGGNPIVLVGQDLAYTEGRAYAQGASRDDMRVVGGASGGRAELVRRKDEMDTAEEAPLVADAITLYPCAGWHGDTVLTGQGLASQRNWLERAIRSIDDQRRVVNATEGGAYIEGAEHLPLADLLAELPVRNDVEERLSAPARDVTARRESLRRFASGRASELSLAVRLLDEGARQAMEAHTAPASRQQRALERFARTDRRVAKLMRKFDEVDAYLSAHGRSGRLEEKRVPELDDLAATYGRIKDAAAACREQYDKLVRRLAAQGRR